MRVSDIGKDLYKRIAARAAPEPCTEEGFGDKT